MTDYDSLWLILTHYDWFNWLLIKNDWSKRSRRTTSWHTVSRRPTLRCNPSDSFRSLPIASNCFWFQPAVCQLEALIHSLLIPLNKKTRDSRSPRASQIPWSHSSRWSVDPIDSNILIPKFHWFLLNSILIPRLLCCWCHLIRSYTQSKLIRQHPRLESKWHRVTVDSKSQWLQLAPVDASGCERCDKIIACERYDKFRRVQVFGLETAEQGAI